MHVILFSEFVLYITGKLQNQQKYLLPTPAPQSHCAQHSLPHRSLHLLWPSLSVYFLNRIHGPEKQ